MIQYDSSLVALALIYISHPAQNSFTLEKYVEKLAQLDHKTGLGPMSKSTVKPFDAQVGWAREERSIR